VLQPPFTNCLICAPRQGPADAACGGPNRTRSGQNSTRGPASASRGSRLRGARVWSRCSASASSPLVLGHSTVPQERAPWTKVPGSRDFRPGGSAACCRMSLPAGGVAGRRAGACRGERARWRACRGWPPGMPWPGRREPSLRAAWAAPSGAIRTWLHALPRRARPHQATARPGRGRSRRRPTRAWQRSEFDGLAAAELYSVQRLPRQGPRRIW
jgi:hypothetical protein